jgi:DNA-binding transcriptional regulator LsrR (DeoR family)
MPERGERAVSLEAALVARRFYLADRQKSEIAQELGISRFKVARLLDEARSAGIVRITVDVPSELDLDLGDALTRTFGIRRAVVPRVIGSDNEDFTLAVIGAAAAEALAGMIGADDVLGLSWGRALSETVEAFTALTGSDVVQLVGGVGTSRSDIGGVELVRRMAARTGGASFALHAPLLVPSVLVARELEQTPSLAETISRYRSLTVAAVGIGSWEPPSSAVQREIGAADGRALIEAGAVADVCGFVLGQDGREVSEEFDGRMIGITRDQLRAVPEVLAVAGGASKVRAIAAALRSGMISTLVTDSVTATQLLAPRSRV